MITLTQRMVPGRVAGLDFSLLVPGDFVAPELPNEDVDISNPTQSVPLALFSSPIALALITVAARPGYEGGAVQDWIEYSAEQFGLDITGLVSGFVGGARHNHPCIFVECEQVQNDTRLVMRIAAIEDANRYITVHAMCAEDLWPSYCAALEKSVASFELVEPSGPTIPCHSGCAVPIHDMPGVPIGEWPMGRKALRRHEAQVNARHEEAEALARALVLQRRYDDAELVIKNADPSIQGNVMLARIYEQLLREAVAASSPTAAELHTRAVQAAYVCFPDPHTEYEAAEFDTYFRQAQSKLNAILAGKA